MTSTKTRPATLTVAEAAAELDYTEKYVYRLIADGEIPVKQRRRRCQIRINRQTIERLKEQWGR